MSNILSQDELEHEKIRGIFAIGEFQYYTIFVKSMKGLYYETPNFLMNIIPNVKVDTDNLMILWALYVILIAAALIISAR